MIKLNLNEMTNDKQLFTNQLPCDLGCGATVGRNSKQRDGVCDSCVEKYHAGTLPKTTPSQEIVNRTLIDIRAKMRPALKSFAEGRKVKVAARYPENYLAKRLQGERNGVAIRETWNYWTSLDGIAKLRGYLSDVGIVPTTLLPYIQQAFMNLLDSGTDFNADEMIIECELLIFGTDIYLNEMC